jgi:hypothetical protein
MKNISRVARRGLIVGSYVGLAMLVLSTQLPQAAGLFLLLAGLALLGGCTFRLYWRTSLWKFGHDEPHKLDERQLSVRAQAYQTAYIVLATLLLLAVISLSIALDKQLIPGMGWSQFQWLTMACFYLTLTLPNAIIAWQEPELD